MKLNDHRKDIVLLMEDDLVTRGWFWVGKYTRHLACHPADVTAAVNHLKRKGKITKSVPHGYWKSTNDKECDDVVTT